MKRRISLNIMNITGISVIVLYWIAYALMTPLANVGDYRYFSYWVWESWSIGLLLIPACTAVWLIAVAVKSAKGKSWRANIVILLFLAILLAGQIGIVYIKEHGVSTTLFTISEAGYNRSQTEWADITP